MIFLDTNVVSETLKQAPNGNVASWVEANERKFAISTVVLAEISFGIFSVRPAERSPRYLEQLSDIRDWFAGRVHGYDEKSALIYGRMMGSRKLAGRPMAVLDGMIAAVALRHNASLATRNIRHFQGIGLTLINPWDA